MKRLLLLLFFALHFTSSMEALTRNDITPSLLQALFSPYFKEDPQLETYIANFPFENYDIYLVENRDIYYADNIPDLIKSQFIRRGVFYEVHVFEQLWHYTKPKTIAIDAGGHIGTHTLSLSRLVEPGIVHVFEPQLKLFVELVINMHLNDRHNIVFHRLALGSKRGYAELYPYQPQNEGGIGIGLGGEVVPIEKLDSFNLNNVSIMKIDVEGHEVEVIEGAKETILRNKPVLLVEIMGGTSYESATPEQREVIFSRMNKIRELGYAINPIGMHDYLCIPLGKKNLRVR